MNEKENFTWPWAGKNWGAITIPRIGQEVVVDFLEGDPDLEILGVDRIETATPRMLTFLASRKYISKLKETKAGAVIVDLKIEGKGRNLLRNPNPYLTYARALELFYQQYRPSPSISPQAYAP